MKYLLNEEEYQEYVALKEDKTDKPCNEIEFLNEILGMFLSKNMKILKQYDIQTGTDAYRFEVGSNDIPSELIDLLTTRLGNRYE